jgi:hypothetical protein
MPEHPENEFAPSGGTGPAPICPVGMLAAATLPSEFVKESEYGFRNAESGDASP